MRTGDATDAGYCQPNIVASTLNGVPGQPISLALQERQKIRIDLVRVRRGHAMREVLVRYQGSVL